MADPRNGGPVRNTPVSENYDAGLFFNSTSVNKSPMTDLEQTTN